MTYRAWVYHAAKPPKLCTSHDEYLAALQGEWSDSPASVKRVSEPDSQREPARRSKGAR